MYVCVWAALCVGMRAHQFQSAYVKVREQTPVYALTFYLFEILRQDSLSLPVSHSLPLPLPFPLLLPLLLFPSFSCSAYVRVASSEACRNLFICFPCSFGRNEIKNIPGTFYFVCMSSEKQNSCFQACLEALLPTTLSCSSLKHLL